MKYFYRLARDTTIHFAVACYLDSFYYNVLKIKKSASK